MFVGRTRREGRLQIDFHHAVTYVVARLAGFLPAQARVIGHSAQYVDDATNGGEIQFTNGAAYSRISSAHKTLDYRNFDVLANSKVWVPFHFLPGNGGQPAGADPEGSFIKKIVCRPDSPVARDMVELCIEGHAAPYALHRLGITMHVYADTWAHQGFAGVCHEINLVKDLRDEDDEPDTGLLDRLRVFFQDEFEGLQSGFVDTFPLGHGAALSHPDIPYLKWSYTNGLGEPVKRDNLTDFMTAAQSMFARMVEFRAATGAAKLPDRIGPADLEKIRDNFATFLDRDGEVRHRKWLQSIAEGHFSFGPEVVEYVPKGKRSWKHTALGDEDDRQARSDGYPYAAAFLSADWKLFHDALQAHRLAVLHDVLPPYGICAS